MRYQTLIHEQTWQKVAAYLAGLQAGDAVPGCRLRDNLQDGRILLPAATGFPEHPARGNWEREAPQAMVLDFFERLVRTKKPQIFAESEVAGDGSDWNLAELSILGDVAMAVPVTVFDNGLHQSPQVHAKPFMAALLYIPGALLRNDKGNTPADWPEVTENDELNFPAYYQLYARRLLPALKYASDAALAQNKQALITVPGLGCGLFAGKFRGQLGVELQKVLVQLLRQNGRRLPGIKAVYYDPYREGGNERMEIEHISLLVRPLTMGNEEKAQLCLPQRYAEDGDDFGDCILFSFVAWDHLSWPGNDFYRGSRLTDDGVKAAATSSMAAMTGIEGIYNAQTCQYEPPLGYQNWLEVVQKQGIELEIKDNLTILSAAPTSFALSPPLSPGFPFS